MDLDEIELKVTQQTQGILNISKALKCKICGKYIVDEDELHKYDTCSDRCREKYYKREYRIKLKK